jgi:hypothetical protein
MTINSQYIGGRGAGVGVGGTVATTGGVVAIAIDTNTEADLNIQTAHISGIIRLKYFIVLC